VRCDASHRRYRLSEVLFPELRAGKRSRTCQQLEGDDAKGIHVRCCRGRVAAPLLRCRVVGWRAHVSKETDLVLDAIDMGLQARDYHPAAVQDGLVHHSDAGSQYTSFRFTQHLIDAGIDASIGTVGDAYDNALAESTIGLYKTELIKPQGPWHTKKEVEVATTAWVQWYNNRRLHGACGGRPPTEFETLYELGDLTSLVA